MSYNDWVALHVLGVVVFVGNLVVTALWKTLADRTREARVVAFSQRLVTVTDIAFTATGAALITVSGFVLADDWGGIAGPSWLTLGFSLFAAPGLIWLTILIPVQVQQGDLLARSAHISRSPSAIGSWRGGGTSSERWRHCYR